VLAISVLVGDDVGMSFNFRAVDRDQQFLMPPSVRDWLPEDHLAWFVLDVVDELDLCGFESRYRRDGRGGSAYAPAMMTALWLYAYCVGERSSRRIERRCVEDVAFRVLAANQQPDHTTIARFRQQHRSALAGLFAQVLALCARAGLVCTDVVALDGTKLEANASMDANRDVAQLEAEVSAWLDEADDVDATEDLAAAESSRVALGRSERRERIRDALSQACGDTTANPRVRRNITDPDSRLMKARSGFVQGYNAQAVVTSDQIVIGAEITNAPVDRTLLVPMLEATTETLADAGVTAALGVLVADAGYWSQQNATADVDCELLIATTTTAKQARGVDDEVAARIAADDRANAADEAEIDRRAEILDRARRRAVTAEQAAAELGLSLGRTYALLRRYRDHGRTGLFTRRHRPNGQRRPDRVRTHTRVKHAMNEKLATERGRSLYARRKTMVEPVFGQHKAIRGFTGFSCRGYEACATEWKLINLTHNLLKLWRR
jgi:transposase